MLQPYQAEDHDLKFVFETESSSFDCFFKSFLSKVINGTTRPWGQISGHEREVSPKFESPPLDQEKNFVKKEDNHVLQIFFSLNLFMFIAMSDIENNLLFFGQ